MKSRVRVGFVGAGRLATRCHYPSLSEIEGAEICAACDLDREKVETVAKKFGISEKFTDYRRMLEKTSPDAVYVVTPPHQAFDIAMDCLERKLHVFIEKPPGITAGQARSLAAAAEKHGCLTMVGFQRRFAPVLVEARKMVEERGGVVQCQANYFKWHRSGPYYRGAIDILACDAVHALDILRWACGEVKKIASVVSRLFSDYDNRFCALLEFENGSAGLLSTNWASGRREFSVEMHGRGIKVFCDPEREGRAYVENGPEPFLVKAAGTNGEADPASFRNTGFLQENRHFIESVRGGVQPLTNFRDACATMELVERIYAARL